ncbi:MAG: hypothetical protein AABZ22_05455, partial [Nitrospirota bacterium]
WLRRREGALQHIGRPAGGGRRPPPRGDAAAADTPNAVESHQPRDPMATAPQPLRPQVPVDPRAPITPIRVTVLLPNLGE